MSTDTSRPDAAAAGAAPAGALPAGLERVSVRQTRRVTGIAFLAWTIAVYDFILFGTLLPDISRDFGWDTSESLLVSTLVSVGTAVIVLLVGPLVDRLGRRVGMVVSVTGTAMSSGATALSAGAASLVGIRSISGLGLAEQSINATYLNEIYELTEDDRIRRNKGFVYAIVQTGWPIGALLAAAFVTLITSVFGPGEWRIAFGLATVPALVVAAVCLTLRESPQFVAQQRIRRLRAAGLDDEAAAFARATGSSFIGAMSQPGAIIGGFLLTALTAGSMTFGTAALWVGAGGILASALVMLLAKSTGESRGAAA